MPYATDDVVRIMDEQSLGATTIRNVYFYQLIATSGTVTGVEILTAFEEQVLDDVTNIQPVALSHDLLVIDNVTDNLSFGEKALTGVDGILSGEIMPTFVSYSFKLLRGTKLTRNGFKRIYGPTETVAEGNTLTSTFFNSTGFQNVAIALGADIVVVGIDGTATARPVIASRPQISGGGYTVQPVVGVQPSQVITTQVSRKLGRGE